MQRFSTDSFQPNRILCKIYAALVTTSISAVSNSCLIQAISRFLIIVLCQHNFLKTFSMNWILIASSRFNSIAIAILLYFVPFAYQYESETSTCTPTTKNYSSALLLCITNIIMTIPTVMILYGIILYRTTRCIATNLPTIRTIRLRRNQIVFRNSFTNIFILTIGGIPYFICTIVNHISHASQSLYLISIFFVAFAIASNSIALLITNQQVRNIFVKKFICRQRNRIIPYSIQLRRMEILPRVQ